MAQFHLPFLFFPFLYYGVWLKQQRKKTYRTQQKTEDLTLDHYMVSNHSHMHSDSCLYSESCSVSFRLGSSTWPSRPSHGPTVHSSTETSLLIVSIRSSQKQKSDMARHRAEAHRGGVLAGRELWRTPELAILVDPPLIYAIILVPLNSPGNIFWYCIYLNL
jgi:hypothetical protein